MLQSRRNPVLEAVLANHRPLLLIFDFLDVGSRAAFQASDFFLRAEFALGLRPVLDSTADSSSSSAGSRSTPDCPADATHSEHSASYPRQSLQLRSSQPNQS